MKKTKKIIPNSENGFILIACLLTLTILSLAGMFGIRKSRTEVSVVRNEGQINLEFYDAEAGLVDALENFQTWMTNSFLLTGDLASATLNSTFTDGGGTPVATIQARCIENSGTDVFGGGPADDIPVMQHIGPPPADSGYSLTFFERRNYGVTTTSTDGNTLLQVGSWKVFNKF
ncbi:MAG: hypothetical protein ACE5DO_03815 [Desulfobacterales bacterium]